LTGPLGSVVFEILKCSQRKLWNAHRVGTSITGLTCRLHLQLNSKEEESGFPRYVGIYLPNCWLRYQFFVTYFRIEELEFACWVLALVSQAAGVAQSV
jgi:hypothetical protein